MVSKVDEVGHRTPVFRCCRGYLPGLEKHIPRKRPELVGLGRNVDTFDWLRRYAYREVHHIAKSVARWVWRHFSADRFSAWQSGKGRLGGGASGKARREAVAVRDASIVRDRKAGMSERAIADKWGLSGGL